MTAESNNRLVALANRICGALESAFDAAVHALAQACADPGSPDLNAGLLDAHQLPSYEIALAAADLLAAKTTLAHADDDTDLDRSLSMVYAADAAAAILQRLESVYLDLGLDTGQLHAIAAGEELQALRRAAVSSAALMSLGRAVADSQGAYGAVKVDESIAMAQDTFRRFSADVVVPQAEHIHRADAIIPETILQPLRELGVFGLAIPEAYGGSAAGNGEDAVLMIAVTEALSEASLGAAGSLITRPEILSRALLTGGTQAQKQAWLPRIAAGNPLCAIAMTEPDHGSDVANITLRAVPAEGGWLLNGAKTWCTFAGKAGLIMVVARTNPDRSAGHRGLSVMLVEKPSYEGHDFDYVQQAGGRLRGRAIPTIGYRGMHSFDLAFEDFFVPDSCVIGERGGIGRGFYLTMAGMVGGRMQTAGRALGVMRASLQAAISYATDRHVFGKPLIDFAFTQGKIARLAARYAACRRLAYAVGRLVDSGKGRMQASLVKLFACRSAEWISRDCMQMHGGMGYAEETTASRLFVDARVLSIFEGAEETLALKVVARSLLEKSLENSNG